MADYSVILADLATGTVHGRFRVSGLRYGRVLNGAGSFSGTLLYADRRALIQNPISASTLAKTAVFVERNESQIMWAGVAWQRRRQSGAPGQAELAGEEFWSYFQRRLIPDTLVFAAQDQLAIARDLILYAQGQAMQVVTGHPLTFAKPGGSIGVTVGSETSGILRDRTYEGSEFKNLGSALEELGALDQGFDWSIECMYTAGLGSSITRAFQLGYPRAGRPAPQSTLRWEFGNQMESYDWPEDATSIATTSYALGAGEGASMLRSSSSAQALIDGGLPLLETARSYKDVQIQNTLDAHAVADSKVDGVVAVTLPQITVRGDADPTVGSFVVGDEARIVIDDPNFPSGAPAGDLSVNTYMRIHSYEVSVDDTGRELVQITLGPVLA